MVEHGKHEATPPQTILVRCAHSAGHIVAVLTGSVIAISEVVMAPHHAIKALEFLHIL